MSFDWSKFKSVNFWIFNRNYPMNIKPFKLIDNVLTLKELPYLTKNTRDYYLLSVVNQENKKETFRLWKDEWVKELEEFHKWKANIQETYKDMKFYKCTICGEIYFENKNCCNQKTIEMIKNESAKSLSAL